jgi:hypothetical protein
MACTAPAARAQQILPDARVGKAYSVAVTVRSAGKPLGNAWIIVEDGLARTTRAVRTDAQGRLRFAADVVGPGARTATVRLFHFGREVGWLQVPVKAEVARIRSLRLRNGTNRALRAEIRAADGTVSVHRLAPGESKLVLREPSQGFRWSWLPRIWGGTEVAVPFAGGQVLISNKGEAEASVFAGVGLLRASVVRSAGSTGVCWAPELGVSGAASLGGALCVSTDGATIGADAVAGGQVVGVSVKFASW